MGRFFLRFGLSLLLALGSTSVLTPPLSAQPLETPPRLLHGRFGMPAVAVGTDIYVVGGATAPGSYPDVERIDTTARPLKVTSFPAVMLGRLFHTAEASGPYIYVMGGMAFEDANVVMTTQVDRLDTRDHTVEPMAPLPHGIRTPASVIIGDKIYLAGGSVADAAIADGRRVDTLLIYDIPTNTWKEGAPMPVKKECDLLPWHGGLLAVGGFDGKTATKGVESYDIATDTWTVLPDLPFPTSAQHGAVVRDEAGKESVIMFGDYAQTRRVLRGDPTTGEWKSIENSGFHGRRHAAVVALNHKLYVLGGNVASTASYYDDIQVFDEDELMKAKE